MELNKDTERLLERLKWQLDSTSPLEISRWVRNDVNNQDEQVGFASGWAAEIIIRKFIQKDRKSKRRLR
jgi:hypothetical protein